MSGNALRLESELAAAPAADVEPSADRGVLRFVTCGSVDDGKSTFIGRLLYDCGLVADDHLEALERDSRKANAAGGLDFSLLVDGLSSEREQGITIDVAYRYFATPRRKFIVADCPGHEQYTRNMVTGASKSALAVILIDARKGVVRQTRRHSSIVRLLGIRDVVLAINKMDLVSYAQSVFEAIAADYAVLAGRLGIPNVTAIPISAVTGANIAKPSADMPWYRGPAVLQHLEAVDPAAAGAAGAARLPVQYVIRPDQNFRGYAGTVAAGALCVNDPVVVQPQGTTSRISAILAPGGAIERATRGDAVVVTLADEVEASRGSILSRANDVAEVSDQFSAHIVWFSQKPLLKGRPYLLQMGPQSAVAQITNVKHVISVETLEPIAAKSVAMNDIARCEISTSRPLVVDMYENNAELGGFILIDRLSNETVGAGMIDFALRRSHNIRWQELDITREQRAAAKGQRPCCLWFTGLSGAGKSTLANLLEKRLFATGRHTYILDGDNVRHGLNRDLGFTDADRAENIRRVAEVAKLMTDAGLITIVSFISPFRAERQFARELFNAGEFIEVFVDTPLEVCERRDPKGLYVKARAGQVANFTGISSPYEAPVNPELRLQTDKHSPEELVEQILATLVKRDVLHA